MSTDSLAVYLPKKNYLNEATSYYIKLVLEALTDSCNDVPIVYTIRGLRRFERVLVIDAKSLVFVKAFYPRTKVLTWYQGVVAEEAKMIFNSNLRYRYWSIFEWLSLRLSKHNIFVSGAMLEYFQLRYAYNDNNFNIVPCFNKQLVSLDKIETRKKESELSICYAGSLHKWQCIDNMLLTFKEILRLRPNARLSFFTFDLEKAKTIVDSYNLSNVEIDSLPLDEIDLAISKHKYGFLLRDDHVVNNVATPTKLSTYLSVCTKPILSDVVFDYNKNLPSNSVLFVPKDATQQIIAKMIVNDHDSEQTITQYWNECDKVFQSYLNRSRYIDELRESITDD